VDEIAKGLAESPVTQAAEAARKRLAARKPIPVKAPLPAEKQRENDEEALRGMWKMKEAHANGKHLPSEVDLNQTWTFADGKIVVRQLDGQKDEWTFKLDVAPSPRGIDLRATSGTRTGSSSLGIYELKGNQLRVCLSWGIPQKRPGRFDAFGDTDLDEDRG